MLRGSRASPALPFSADGVAMWKSRWIVVGIFCALAAAPIAHAQRNVEPEELEGAFWGLFGPNWNLFAHAGWMTGGQYLLQNSPGVPSGERALRSEDAFSVGGGVGVDLLPRMGWRLDYTYASSDIGYRTDIGDGSRAFDVDDVATLASHVVSIEIVRYMLPTTAAVTPYAGAGLLGAWWDLSAPTPGAVANNGTEFRFGALASLGVQLRLGQHVRARLEAVTTSSRNPFTGRDSFRATSGTTIDEPGRVSRIDYRLVGTYSFGRPRSSRRR
jgi:opacity protein-like surface antigen